MKLRVQGNSIRFRLTQTEVSSFGEGNMCLSSIQFPNGQLLTYRLTKGTELRASFDNNTITITLSQPEVDTWVASEQVGIKGNLTLENGDKLSILVEKDFKCLTERSEDESDMFPNPKESH